MLPFQPPLPVAWNLPFQPAAGSQTSILMSESADGLSVAATRQNAGRSVNCAPPPRPVAAAPPPRPPAGGVNAPAGTSCAIVIVASVSFREESASHDCATAVLALRTTRERKIATAARPKGRALRVIGERTFISLLRRAHPFGWAGTYLRSGNANTYSACPVVGTLISGAIVAGTSRGLPPPSPVVTATYCLPSTLKEIGNPCTDVARRVCHSTLPV